MALPSELGLERSAESVDAIEKENRPSAVFLEDTQPVNALDESHRAFLFARHGTINLVPLPSASPKDPLNWPAWKKNCQLLMVAFHSMVAIFQGAGLISAFEVLAGEYKRPVVEISYLASVQILVFGVAPIFWGPVSWRFGRHPVVLVSTLGSMACNLGGAWCTTYGTQMVTRGLCAFFISPTLGFGSAVVTECFFAHERAQKMGWWTLMITIGAPTGPFITGFVVQYLSTQWMFWIFAIINAIQFLTYVILGGETLHSPEWQTNEEHYSRHLTAFCPRRINPTPFCLNEFCHFLTLSIVPEVVVPSFSYTVVFCYVTIAPLIEMPIAIGERFHLDAQQTGLQFLAMLIGSILGELISGPVSDLFQKRRSRKHGIGFEDPSVATNRLQISYIGFVASIVGLIVWGVCIEQASSQWTVKPLVGGAIAAFGNQVITTTLVTYAVDCHRGRSQEIGIYVNFVRQIYGFIGPFYLPLMFETLGFSGSGCLMAGLVGLFACVPIAILHYVKSR